MTFYIKVRPYVAERLGVEGVRQKYADGNVLIWDKELKKVDPGWVFHRDETVARIGGLLMDPYRNKEEQAKSADECTPLPMPTDPMWALPEEDSEEDTDSDARPDGTGRLGNRPPIDYAGTEEAGEYPCHEEEASAEEEGGEG